MAGIRVPLLLAMAAVFCWTAASQEGGGKVPRPKSRLRLLEQMQTDLDAAAARANLDPEVKKKTDHCHEVLIDAMSQQQRYKSVNKGKVNGCMKDIGTLLESGIFQKSDAGRLAKDRAELEQSVGSAPRFHLPKSL